MIFNQLLPKGTKVPELSLFELKGLTFDVAKNYLSSFPASNCSLGIEIVATAKGITPCFFIESHSTELNLEPLQSEDEVSELDIDYYSCYASKPSIFPFAVSKSMIWAGLDGLQEDEEIIIQIIMMKKHQDKINNLLWTQYEDYINGVELVTSNKLIRAVQMQILEVMKKVEGGYRKHLRINESERKLQEDVFNFEMRFSIAASSVRKEELLKKVKSILRKHNFINTWSFSKQSNKDAFADHMRLRRFSLFQKAQYLSCSEIAGLFVTEEVSAVETVKENQQVMTLIEETETESKEDKSPFFIFPFGAKKSHEHDNKIAGDINKALRKLNLISDDDVIVQKIQNGSTVKRITFTLPEGLKLTSLKRAISDIQTELALNDIGITQGVAAGTAILSVPQEEREAVFVRDCVEDEEFKKFQKKAFLPLLIGKSETGEIVFVDLVEIKHLLIAGSTGSGKSVFVNTLLTVLLTLVSPADLQMILIDPKMVELAAYEKYPHVRVFTDMSEVEGVLSYLCEQMDERYAKFKEKSYKNIQQYNRNESVKMPYTVLVIDELADLIMQYPDCESLIVRLAQKARACGIHLIIATQRPQKEVLTGLIKGNIYSRICFACDSGVSYRVALDETPEFTLLGKGDGAYRFEGIQGLHRFQGALIAKTEEEQDAIINKLSTHWKVKGSKQVIDIQLAKVNRETKELNEFKQLILSTSETRTVELKKQLNVRNEKIKELLDKVVELGWLKQHKQRSKGYEWILTEEERKKELERIGELK